jgi:hypothetical protein
VNEHLSLSVELLVAKFKTLIKGFFVIKPFSSSLMHWTSKPVIVLCQLSQKTVGKDVSLAKCGIELLNGAPILACVINILQS